MFLAFPKFLKPFIIDVSPNHWRLQAVILDINSKKFLLINSYFPCDPGTINFDDSALQDVLCCILNLIYDNSFDHLVICGDLNTNFNRHTGFVQIVNDFVQNNMLFSIWDIFNIDHTQTTERNGVSYFSTIDHFIFNESLNNMILDAGTLHSVNNSSNHIPIYLSLNIGKCETHVSESESNLDSESYQVPKPLWHRATEFQRLMFKENLEIRLNSISKPTCLESCNDLHCKNSDHRSIIDDYLCDVLSAINDVSYESLPLSYQSNGSPSRKLPLWNEFVKPYREKAIFWRSIWLSSGRPTNNELHKVMKYTRNCYHYQVRKCKRLCEKIKSDNFLNACLNNDVDLFSMIKKSRHSSSNVAATIDNISGKSKIANHFANIYETTFNEINDQQELSSISDSLNSRIYNSSLIEIRKINPTVVLSAVSKLKRGKSDPVMDFSTDCIKNSPPILFDHLSSIFRYFLIHGYISSFLTVSTIIPLIKNKLGKKNESKNYRSIAISSIFLKIIDWIVILLYGDMLKLNELQFSYQPDSSTTMCSWVLLETVTYFKNNGSAVYGCTMDMRKAFDKVCHSKLFYKLIDAKIPSVILRFILFTYINQSVNVRWDNSLSKSFPLSNGVKQGAVLSAILYCFYTNKLFETLKKKRSGCWIQGQYYGIIGYADDIVLIAPSLTALQEMINTSFNFASAHNLEFSTDVNPAKSKTKCIAFNNTSNLYNMVLNGKSLPWVHSIKHLGNMFEEKINGMKKDISMKKAQFINRINQLNQEFCHHHPFTKFKLCLIYNCDFTGSPLWDLFSTESIKLENSWNISCRIMFGLPRNTHRYLIEPVTSHMHVKAMLIKRQLKFIEGLKHCVKSPVRNLYHVVKYNVNTITGSNLRNIKILVNKNNISNLSPLDAISVKYHPIDADDHWRVDMILELIDVKHHNSYINNFNYDDIQDILNYVCSS